jgi:hypothetical protein
MTFEVLCPECDGEGCEVCEGRGVIKLYEEDEAEEMLSQWGASVCGLTLPPQSLRCAYALKKKTSQV